MSKISLLSFYTSEFQPIADITLHNKQKYCDKFNYKHLIQNTPYGNPMNYYAFERLRYLRDLLFNNNEYDIVWVANIHSLIMNFTIKFDDYLDSEHDFFITSDINGINAGSFIVRKSEWLKEWLDFLLSKENIHKNHEWFEQKLIQDYWQLSEFKDKIKILPQNTINSYFYELYDIQNREGQFIKGTSLLFHLPGKPANTPGTLIEERIKVLTSDKIKDNIIYG